MVATNIMPLRPRHASTARARAASGRHHTSAAPAASRSGHSAPEPEEEAAAAGGCGYRLLPSVLNRNDPYRALHPPSDRFPRSHHRASRARASPRRPHHQRQEGTGNRRVTHARAPAARAAPLAPPSPALSPGAESGAFEPRTSLLFSRAQEAHGSGGWVLSSSCSSRSAPVRGCSSELQLRPGSRSCSYCEAACSRQPSSWRIQRRRCPRTRRNPRRSQKRQLGRLG